MVKSVSSQFNSMFSNRESAKGFEYEVDRILRKKRTSVGIMYLVKWIGWAVEEATWEPLINLYNSLAAVKIFEKNRYLKKKSKKLNKQKLRTNSTKQVDIKIRGYHALREVDSVSQSRVIPVNRIEDLRQRKPCPVYNFCIPPVNKIFSSKIKADHAQKEIEGPLMTSPFGQEPQNQSHNVFIKQEQSSYSAQDYERIYPEQQSQIAQYRLSNVQTSRPNNTHFFNSYT